MTEAVRLIIESIDRLPDPERAEAVAEVLRRAAGFDHPPLEDEELARIADETFLMYDAEESAHE